MCARSEIPPPITCLIAAQSGHGPPELYMFASSRKHAIRL
jgi:hypothetical protein